MALKIRLRQQGRTNRQTYRLVLTDVRNPRDGKYIEMLGSYNPTQELNNVTVNAERVVHWLGLGAQMTNQAATLIKKAAPDVMKQYTAKQVEQRAKLAAKRKVLRKSTAK